MSKNIRNIINDLVLFNFTSFIVINSSYSVEQILKHLSRLFVYYRVTVVGLNTLTV